MSNLIAMFAVAVLLGGMIFFAAVIAPLVFTRLPAEQAGAFIRAVFPFYYLYVLIGSAIAAVALIPRWDGAWMAGVAALTLWLRQWLMPKINTASDAARLGNDQAKKYFNRAHQVSVLVNFAQIILIGFVLMRFVA